jgi:uncharacterized protein (DUF2141 family)
MRSHTLRSVALCTLAIAGLAATAARSDGPTSNEIRVEVVGLRSDKGTVDCLLFSSADGFPGDAAKAAGKMKAIIEHGRAACTFDEPRAGTYAVAFIHDENENGKLDTNFLGIPSEGIGASNDAKATFGPPKWDDAKFVHALGLQALELHPHYF